MNRERPDPLAAAAREARRRAEQAARHPEPSLAARLGQIGVLGWMIVLPALGGALVGRLLDKRLHTGIEITAALLMLGAALGFWMAWRWMRRP
ncbi:ATP synthase subunit [Sphingomonas histidinilytica]|uniref:AtpZ/AtpI family protein n=1 Tax=Sphingomonadales TaxID=204457 RepID=UPI00076FE360|nr:MULTISPECIES: AtpZ/AtpI family protein [Sphingomonadaceae]AMK23020.1 H(+)-transporting ATP synthase, gene 1 [Sphingobium sp. TKS]MBO9378761.1 ATP synthase subunit [Rhizorhabdus histidinilytica]MCF8706758.1 AtpZ/AtpI family protein [Rhizorhapis sp. SPR117]